MRRAPDWIVSTSRNKTERKGDVMSTKVSNKYDLLDDVETNVKAEIDEDEDEKKKEKGKEKESEKESSVHALPHTAPRLCLTARRARRSSNRSRPSLSVAMARRPAAPRR